jgi:hypothetical protein
LDRQGMNSPPRSSWKQTESLSNLRLQLELPLRLLGTRAARTGFHRNERIVYELTRPNQVLIIKQVRR